MDEAFQNERASTGSPKPVVECERPSTKYARITPPSKTTLQMACVPPSPTLPRRQSPKIWKCTTTERFPLRSSITGSGRAGKAGELIGKDGSRYLGEVLAGRPHGRGQYLIIKGNQFFVQYEGEYVHGVRSGYGIRNYLCGERYIGEWVWDMRAGNGRMEYKSGDVYEGEWDKDRRNGVGSFHFKNGDIFVGTYVNDKKEGLGTLYMVSRWKKLVSEYYDDISKCGTLLDIAEDELVPLKGTIKDTFETAKAKTLSLDDPEAVPCALQKLDLKQPYTVVAKEIEDIRKAHTRNAQVFRKIQQSGGTTGHIELQKLRHSFTQLVGGDSVDSHMIPDQLPHLCHLVGLDPSCQRAQTLFSNLLDQRSKDGKVYLEDFLRMISHFRGLKLAAVDLDKTLLSNTWNWNAEDSYDLTPAATQLAN